MRFYPTLLRNGNVVIVHVDPVPASELYYRKQVRDILDAVEVASGFPTYAHAAGHAHFHWGSSPATTPMVTVTVME